MQTRLLFVAALLLPAGLLFAGCAVNQVRERAIYREVIDLPAADPLDTTLTLLQALRIANQNNENLSIQGENYLRTLIERRRRVAAFIPTVNLTSSYIRRDDDASGASGGTGAANSNSGGSSSGGSTGSGDSGTETDDDSDEGNSSSNRSTTGVSRSRNSGSGSSADDAYSFTLNSGLRWNLFNGFRDWHGYWRDTFLIEQRRHDLLQFQEDLLLDVADVFFQIQRSAASVRVLENSLKVQRARISDTQARQQVGFSRLLDVTQSEAQAANTQTTLINARRDLANARELLSLLIGTPLGDVPVNDAYPTPATLESPDPWLDAAEQNRSDLRASAAALRSAEREVKIAFGQYYPSVTLTADAFLLSEPAPSARDWQAALNATLPIIDGGRIHADVREAWSFVREARLVNDYLRRQVAQEVRTAHQNYIAGRARLDQLAVQLDAARQAFEQAEASYSVGLATNLDRIAAQDALLNAELDQAGGIFDLKLYHLRLLRAIGELREVVERPELLLNSIDRPPTMTPEMTVDSVTTSNPD